MGILGWLLGAHHAKPRPPALQALSDPDMEAPPSKAVRKRRAKVPPAGREADPKLAATRWCDFEVVGEHFHQGALMEAAGGRKRDGVQVHCTASLVPEPENPYDANAVAVHINGVRVAHLSRQHAREYRRRLKSLGVDLGVFECPAYICGGWDRGKKDQGDFGVKLGLVWPVKLAKQAGQSPAQE